MKKLIIIISLVISSLIGHSQWQYIDGLEYRYFENAISANGYLFGYDLHTKIYISDNNGASWNMFVDFDSLYIENIAVSDTMIYAFVYSYEMESYKMYYSSVNNISWIGYPCNGLWNEKKSRSSNSDFLIKDNYLFMGCGDGNIYKSEDKGHTWKKSSSGLITGFHSYCNNTSSIFNLSTDGNRIFAGTQCYGVYASDNNGQNWYELNNGIPMETKTGVGDIAINSSKIFAATTKGLYSSTDSGSNWIYDSISASDIGLHENFVLIPRYQKSYYSIDNGESWSIILGDRSPRWIIADSSGFYMEGWGINGVSRLSITDTSLSMKSYGLTKNNAIHMFQKDSLLLVSTESGGLYHSYDLGLNWHINENSLLNIIVNSIIETNITLVAATSNGIYYSNNNGTDWTTTVNDLSDFAVSSIVLFESDLYAGTKEGVYKKSTDDTLWYPNNTGLDDRTINNLYQYLDTLYSCTNTGIYYYNEVDNNWQIYCNELSDIEIYSMQKDEEVIVVGGKDFIYYSSDKGVNWSFYDIGVGEQVNYIMSVDTNIFVASSSGIYVYWDDLQTWFNLFPNSDVRHLVSLSDSVLFAITKDGIYNTELSQSFILNIPDIYSPELINIYPNPTSLYITIDSDQTKIDEVGILDNTGRLLKIVTKEFKSIDVSNLSSGIYYLRILTGEKIITRKFIKQ